MSRNTLATMPTETTTTSAIVKNSDVSIDISIINNSNIVTEIVEQTLIKYTSESLAIQNITSVIAYIMELVEKTDIKGKEQKKITINVITKITSLLPETDQRRIDILKFIDTGGADNLIEIIISASKGEFDINKIIQTGYSCMKTFRPYFTKFIKSFQKKK